MCAKYTHETRVYAKIVRLSWHSCYNGKIIMYNAMKNKYLTETAGNIIFGPLIRGVYEQVFGFAIFNEIP